MAYAKKGIYHFRTPNEYGVDVMPLNRAVFVESTGLFYSLSSDAGLSGSSTIQNAIDNGNLTPLVDGGGGIPPVIQTDTPLLDGPSNAGEGETITFVIKNYQPEYQYTVGVSMGEVTREGSVIKWSLPRVGTDTMMNVSVSALKQNQVISEIATTNTFVLNSGTVVDQNFILDAASMSDGICSTINTSVVAGELEANDLLGDIQKVGYTSTTDVVYIDNEMVDIEVGDTIKTNSETFRVGTVSNDGIRTGLEDVKSITTGNNTTYYIDKSGVLWTLGDGRYGITRVTTPYAYKFKDTNGYITNVKSVHAGNTSVYVLKEDNSLWGIGQDTFGQLGNGNVHSFETFIKIADDVKTACIGYASLHLIKTDGTWWRTGKNDYGSMGDGTTTDINVLTQEASASTDNIKITAGVYYTGIIKADNNLWTCGYNNDGVLGDGTTVDKHILTREATNSTNNYQASITNGHLVVIKTDGTLFTCGNNANGRLGVGDTTNRHTLTQEATNSTDNVQGESGRLGTLVIKTDKSLWTCGNNVDNYLGFYSTSNVDMLNKTYTSNCAYLFSDRYDLVQKTNGEIYGAGSTQRGEFGYSVEQNTESGGFSLCNFGPVVSPTDISGYYSKYWITPEAPLATAPTNCYLQNHKAVSCNITQDQADRDWKAFNNASLTEIKVNSIGATASTTTKIYLNSTNIEAKLQDKFVTDSGEVFSVKEIVESPNYYVVPEVTLINVPTAVYALTTVSLNEVPLIVDSVNIGADLTHTFKDRAFNKTRAINFKFSLPDSGKLKTLSASLEKLG